MIKFLKDMIAFGPSSTAESEIPRDSFLVDVRTPAEFAQGRVNGSVNIPLDQIPDKIAKFKNKSTIVVFCRSGNRSAQAKSYLEKKGFSNVVNARTWTRVNDLLTKMPK